jgi:hypothetical protein
MNPGFFTAKHAKNAKGPHISENPGDSSVRDFPDTLPDFHSRELKIPEVSLRTNGEAGGTLPTGLVTRVGWVPGVLCGSSAMSR